MNKIDEALSIQSLQYLVTDLKKHNKTIGFTHGAFDLFHAGHLHLLKEASKKCDFLIVGVDSDSMISQYKSVKRPIICEKDRVEIVNQIGVVGNAFVLNFDKPKDDYYAKLYSQLQIDKLFVGYNFAFLDRLKARTEEIGAKLNVIYGYRNHTSFIISKILNSQS